ncbi:MucR family transcriptional regulator [Sphingomonas sp. BK580]|uniref:MucR family transcriptional regulator n=1 Tax=Sphingomonas sp. BK580 TaxID=2586972 RepID=UPI00161D3B32|nr:MucR family transcriptional regulator [Sphingomonas sp. BK580]MBB3694823.1 putative transcriptional regulator [Sphingomonas sp. BK580]
MTTTFSERSAEARADTIALAAELTTAWLTNPHTRAGSAEVLAFLTSMHEAVSGLSSPALAEGATSALEHVPAVSVRKSLADPNRIISMIDGKPYASLKRHLASHGLTAAEYRERFSLKTDYPMVAPGYSEGRRALAKQIGLGRKAASAAESVGAAIEQVAEDVVGNVEKGGKAALGAARKTLGIRT